jgi:hypothetical protein
MGCVLSLSSLMGGDAVFIPRSWMNVTELLQEVKDQTDIPHRVMIPDTLGKMVLYDNLTDAKGVREAVAEYYIYVLGQMVRWDQEDYVWTLRRHWDLDLPVTLDLPSLEEEWAETVMESLRLAPQETMDMVSGGERTDGSQGLSELGSHLLSRGALDPKPDLPPWKTQEFDPQLQGVELQWWKRMLGFFSLVWLDGDERVKANLRRIWHADVHMGKVPLVELAMGGDVGFKMGGSSPPLSDTFSMEPEVEENVLPDSDTWTQDSSVDEMSESRARVLPRRILSFAPKNWWSKLKLKKSVHKEEPKQTPISRRVKERRDQAERWYDLGRLRWSELREKGRSRREKE